MASIALEGVTKSFPDGTVAVRELDLAIDDGELLVLVGPSGSGKTTALRMVAGLEELSSGTIRIGETAVNDVPPRERDIAMVFQNYALFPHMTVYKNMAVGMKIRKRPEDEIRRRVEEASSLLDIGEYLDRKPGQLSGGQRQRVAMGRAIVREPAAFLMDEPLSNLDAKLRVEMRAEIVKLQRRLGTTTMYVTHDQTEAITMAHRVAVMRQGVLQQVDEPRVLYERPVNLFVAGFIGSPPMNLVAARLEVRDGRVFAAFGGHSLPVPDHVLKRGRVSGTLANREIVLGVRPEDIEDAEIVSSDVDRQADVTVDVAEVLGGEVLAHFEIDAPPVQTKDTVDLAADLDPGADPATPGRLMQSHERATFTARLHRRSRASGGDRLRLAFDVDRLYLFDPASGAALS